MNYSTNNSEAGRIRKLIKDEATKQVIGYELCDGEKVMLKY